MPKVYKPTTSNLWYLFHHVFLPPKLPNGDDCSAEDDANLLKIVQDCLDDFSCIIGEEYRGVVRGLYKTVDRMRYTRNINGYLDEDRLYEEFKKPITGTIVEWALEVTEQNAGLLIRKSQDRAIFEPFELSPDNASIMTTRGRLIRQFPSVSVSVPADVIGEPGFNQIIANTLATMSYQAVPGMRPQVIKAKQYHDEERDTIKPDVVTEFLVGFLFSLGCQINQQGLCKNTREEVMWNSSKLPWRRSPTWLLVRVTLQLTMNRATSTRGELYKQFIIFFLSRILEFACSHDMTSDVLHVMASKISRRLVKFQTLEPGQWIEAVDKSMKTAANLMEKRWCMIGQRSDPNLDLGNILSSKPGNDVYIHMPKLDGFLASIKSCVVPLQGSCFTPKSQLQYPSSNNLPSITFNPDERDYWPFQLAIIESWIVEYLDIWLQENIRKPSSCYDLTKTILNYHTSAHRYYKNSPEGSSQMLLIILELWIAIDKCAITNLPLLKDYDHEIPTEVFQSLLLCHLHDMERLNRIERYIEQRNVFSRQKSCPSIFRAFNDAQCFSIRYFFGSIKHQTMLRDIETQAKADRSAKIDELKLLQEAYRKLMELHSQSECQYYEVIDKWGDSQELHSTSCHRCGYEAKAKQLMIKVHEWPLPSSTPAKQAVVVELDPPIPLQVWRDATIYLIQDVLGSFCSNELAPRAQYALRDYYGLRDWQVPNICGRIHLLSEVKPHFGTHRKNRTVESLGESDICLNNGLKFLYFDGENNVFMSKLETSKAFLRNHLIKLPERSKELEKFISRTYARPNGEEPNEVIASQHEFPIHMKLNEGKALASIPCGYKL
ncbi:hypothetical protein EAE99_007769 [Botrytis elliptica]|nr:hypothetical protein EAE99_007769 [Botrytis elliptica]